MTQQLSSAHISIARDYSSVPAGRFKEDGPFSGQRFREEMLLPALRSATTVTVDLDGVEGYGSSFLEEAFGGLVRVDGFTDTELRNRLLIQTNDPAWLQEVWTYIDRRPSNKA